MDKKTLRVQLHEKRNTLYNNFNEFNRLSICLQKHVLDFPLYKNAEIICAYASTKSEISTDGIIRHAWEQKKNVLFPLCSKTEKGIMHFYACRDFSDLEKGAYNIFEPKAHCPLMQEELLNSPKTLVLVPALSFSSKGYRLGYGQGFYDRFLAKIPQAVTVGITFSALISEKIPQEPWDLPVKFLATENGVQQI